MKTVSKRRLVELPLTHIHPQGFLREFLERQRSGLTGHFQESKYPFDTCMWTGKAPAYHRDCEYQGRESRVPESEMWWPYEQSGYLLDGMMRVGILLQDDQLLNVFKKNLEYLLSHPLPDGRLGGAAYDHHSEWPMAVFYKAVSAYLKCYPDERIIEAFHRHFSALPEEGMASEFRWIPNIEGMLDMARLTGDETLRQKAFECYRRFNEHEKPHPFFALTKKTMETLENPVFHGVSLCEEVKVPVLLYLAGGDESFLKAAERCWEHAMHYHRQITDMLCAVEYGYGRDPNQGYETCVISDSLYSLGFFLMAEGKGAYADQMEKIAYNALPGSITKDFCTLQYLSAPNQVLATPYSNSSSYLRGLPPFRQYRPDHFPACCPGNVHRAMPNFIARLWMQDESGAPVAALYGASEAEGTFGGAAWRIREETEYPFGESIRFVFQACGDSPMPFIFRIPGWCREARLTLNGDALSIEPEASGQYVMLERQWKQGDVLELVLPMAVRHLQDRQWSWFEAGPLVYTLPIEHSIVKENPDSRFSPLDLRPVTPWSYAVAPEATATLERTRATGYPLEHAASILKVKARLEQGAFASLENHRYTPRVPLECNLGDEVELTLVPMGMTETRLTAFPDGKQRVFHPALSSFARMGSDEETLAMSPEQFVEGATQVMPDVIEYDDLIKYFGSHIGDTAWLQIRFWSEVEAPATLAVMVSGGCKGFFNGTECLEIPPLMDARSMEPLWFKVNLQKGSNYLLLKVLHSRDSAQHPNDWGAKATLFRNEK